MAKRQVVRIDITDWRDECLQEEVSILSEDDIIHLVVEGDYKTGQVGTYAVVLREMEFSPDDIIKPNKELLYSGARRNINQIVASRTREVELANGRIFTVREFLALGKDGEDGKAYVSLDSERAVNLATSYVLNTVPGHIFERLKQIAVAGNDVQGVADLLCERIHEMVSELTEEPHTL